MPSWIILVGIFIPLMAATSYAGPGLLGVKFSFRKALLIGVVVGTIDFYIRGFLLSLKIPPATDTIVYVLIMISALRLIGGVNWLVATAGTLVGYILIFSGEFIVIPLATKITGVDIMAMYQNPWLLLPTAWFGNIMVIVGAALVGLTKIRIIDLSGREKVAL